MKPLASTTLIFIPGLMCDQASFDPIRPHLHWNGPIEVADHGDASSLVEMAQAILNRYAGPIFLWGHSMGGRVALEILRLDPARCVALVLMGTGYAARDSGALGEDETIHRQSLIDLAQEQGIELMAHQWLKGMLPQARLRDMTLIQAITQMFSRKTVSQFQSQQHALLKRPDATHVLQKSISPILFICGALDSWAPPSQHQAMKDLAANSSLSVLPGVGHMCIMENPGLVAQSFNTWVRNYFIHSQSP